MAQRPDPRPEGTLIGSALKRSGIKVKLAAERAGISDTRWRQIVAGYQTPTAGHHIAVQGKPEIIARMAHVVGVTPEQLEEAGRQDAAIDLRQILNAEPVTQEPATPQPISPSVLANPTEQEIWAMRTMPEIERADHIATVRARRLTAELREQNIELRRQLADAQRQIAELTRRAS